MKLTLEEKVKIDRPLNIGELARASGFSRFELTKLGIRKRDLPVPGKMRLSVFEKKYHAGEFEPPKLKHESLAPLNDLRSIVDKLRAPRRSNVLQAASRRREQRPLRSSELQMSPA